MNIKYKSPKGFILIQLIILIGLLALNPGCTENKYINNSYDSSQVEVMAFLQDIYNFETRYLQDNDQYLAFTDIDEIEHLMQNPPHIVLTYSYSVSITEDGFIATAVKNLDEDPVLDTWTIDENRHIKCLIDDVILM